MTTSVYIEEPPRESFKILEQRRASTSISPAGVGLQARRHWIGSSDTQLSLYSGRETFTQRIPILIYSSQGAC